MRLAPLLHRAALTSGLSSALAGRQRVRRILMLHGVGDDQMPVHEFEDGIAWLARHQRVVPLGRMVDELVRGQPVASGGQIAVTFDDGLRNQFELAYPILQRHGVPATFFVCPGLIDEGRWIWNQEARARLHALEPAQRAACAAAFGPGTSDVETIVARMKTLPYAARRRAEDQLRGCTPDFVPDEAARRACDPLSWDEFAHIDPALVTIGSHTLHHPILTRIDDAMLEREIVDSRRVLEQRLKRTVDLFCYPNGAMDPRVRGVVARTYRAAVTTEYGFVAPAPELHRLRRIPGAPGLPLLAWRMHRPTA